MSRTKKLQPADGLGDIVMIRCTAEQKRQWTEAAQRDGLRLAAWVRMTLVRAVRAPDPT